MKVFKFLAERLRSFRPTPVAVVLFVIATVRMAMSGSGIGLAGICAGVVPFVCVCGKWEGRQEPEPAGMIADWLCGMALAAIYLGWMLAVTAAASTLNPAYAPDPLLLSKLAVAVAGDALFVCAAYPLCALLPKGARLLSAIVLVNAQIVLMLLCDALGASAQAWATPVGFGFSGFIAVVTLGLILALPRMNAKLR